MPPRCLDLTRLVSRAGQGPLTGVDRVELAYLDALLACDDPFCTLVRTAAGFSLLERDGTAELRRHITGQQPWGMPDFAARLSRRLSPVRRAAESDVRRLASNSVLRGGLARLARRNLAPGTRYLNTGHSNLDEATFAALRRVPDLKIAVLVHDLIPLDFPQYQRPGTPEVFSRKMRTVARHADLVICNSHQTTGDVARHFPRLGRVPPCVTAHLGVDFAVPDPALLPPLVKLDQPYFVALGTIEPRKNHAVLLDVWDDLARRLPDGVRLPELHIVGNRGWNNVAVFDRLDTHPPAGVYEHNALPDSAVAALLQSATALLCPSHAEGFGLPLVEAAALGTPVICAPLPVYREFLGGLPIYVGKSDLYHWGRAVSDCAQLSAPQEERNAAAKDIRAKLTWESHFNIVLTVT